MHYNKMEGRERNDQFLVPLICNSHVKVFLLLLTSELSQKDNFIDSNVCHCSFQHGNEILVLMKLMGVLPLMSMGPRFHPGFSKTPNGVMPPTSIDFQWYLSSQFAMYHVALVHCELYCKNTQVWQCTPNIRYLPLFINLGLADCPKKTREGAEQNQGLQLQIVQVTWAVQVERLLAPPVPCSQPFALKGQLQLSEPPTSAAH